MQSYEILDNKGVIHSFECEEEALKAWDAIANNVEAFESVEAYEKAKAEYDNFYSVGELKLVKVLAYLH